MSALPVYTVACDKCHQNFSHQGVPRYADSARREVKKHGWVRRQVNGRMMDLCPACQMETQQPTLVAAAPARV